MGIRPAEQTERNLKLYKSYKKKGLWTKRQRKYWMKKLDVNERRLYQIVAQVEKKMLKNDIF